MPEQEQAELAAWRNGPWVLKSDHDRLVKALADQLKKALAELAKRDKPLLSADCQQKV